MADACSLSKKGFLDCGSSRGRSETVFLYECRDDLTAHLKNCFFVACRPQRVRGHPAKGWIRTFAAHMNKLCSYQCYARGGGGPRDEVGTLNVIAHPTWGILANFEHKCWPRDREV